MRCGLQRFWLARFFLNPHLKTGFTFKLVDFSPNRGWLKWHQDRQFIRLLAASSGASNSFTLLISHKPHFHEAVVVMLPMTCKQTLTCKTGRSLLRPDDIRLIFFQTFSSRVTGDIIQLLSPTDSSWLVHGIYKNAVPWISFVVSLFTPVLLSFNMLVCQCVSAALAVKPGPTHISSLTNPFKHHTVYCSYQTLKSPRSSPLKWPRPCQDPSLVSA